MLTLTVSAAPGSQSPLNSAHFSAPTAVVGTISATASPTTWTWTIPSGTVLAPEATLTGSMVFTNHQPRYVLTMDVTSGTEYFGATSSSTSTGYTLAGGGTCTLI